MDGEQDECKRPRNLWAGPLEQTPPKNKNGLAWTQGVCSKGPSAWHQQDTCKSKRKTRPPFRHLRAVLPFWLFHWKPDPDVGIDYIVETCGRFYHGTVCSFSWFPAASCPVCSGSNERFLSFLCFLSFLSSQKWAFGSSDTSLELERWTPMKNHSGFSAVPKTACLNYMKAGCPA